MNNKLISIIVPCYNQSQFLDECLQSVLNQTYINWECLIINDGSPDNTDEVANKWLQKDSRFKYYLKENGGLSSARNYGISKALGSWILPLDNDDYISSDYLTLASKHFQNENLKVIYCNAENFGALQSPLELTDFSLEQLAKKNIIFCTAFFRKVDWNAVGGYDENLKAGLEDWEFWINILKNGGSVLKLSEVCFFYRIKENSMLVDFCKSKTEKEVTYKIIEKKHIDFFQSFFVSMHTMQESHNNYNNLQNKKLYKFVNKIYTFARTRKVI